MTRLGLALLLSIAVSGTAAAQPTGRIEGRVFDASTGEPLVGGQVRIEEIALGNVTREDGSFFIERVPVGVHSIQTEYLGYQEEIRETRILPGETTRMEFALGGAAIDSPVIVATIEYEPWIPGVTLPVRPAVAALPTLLPDPTPVERCDVQTVLHGAYIEDGRWQQYASVGALRCWSKENAVPAPCDQRPLALGR